MTIRLNARIRKIILTRLMSHRFEKEMAERDKAWKAFEQEVYEDVYPKKDSNCHGCPA